MSLGKAAKVFGVPKPTIWLNLKKNNNLFKKMGPSFLMTPTEAEEASLASYMRLLNFNMFLMLISKYKFICIL